MRSLLEIGLEPILFLILGKLHWAFRLYDEDHSGTISANEMTSIIKMMQEMEGNNDENDTEAKVEELFK